jgi:hypothetical protein
MKVAEVKSTEELIELLKVCGWLFAVVVVMLVFGTIVVAFLYSIIFVTQPIKSLAPLDASVLKMLNDIVLLLVGSITTLIGMYALNKGSRAIANRMMPTPPMQPMCGNYGGSQGGYGGGYQSSPPAYNPQGAYGGLPSQPFGAMPVWTNPELDESWTPPPPPTTPPDLLEDDDEREQLAQARKETD